MNYEDLTIVEYDNLVSARKSVPGGGNVLGMLLAHSISLCLMDANFTIGKKGYEHLEDEVNKLIIKLEKYKKQAYRYANLDSEAFVEFMDNYKIIKQEGKVDELEALSIKCAAAPYNLYVISKKVKKIAKYLIINGNKSVKSDAELALKIADLVRKDAFDLYSLNLQSIREENRDKVKGMSKNLIR